ncbi:helix-turn-helix transcriptional regulator [Pseudomonas sp. LS44]|uniref:helix-turn-helix transcriptional regulator n=1 Tax=Pseudomonas sp. LS44 TaxID=1357074 RepID=UPI00215AAE6F|nr:helix-turn-helix transcriptional regulator [Pseudomonas sp. LS44]UVE17417.1 helix-turn-helix transcriptional regulator [Pseudomonas sp. LS44]
MSGSECQDHPVDLLELLGLVYEGVLEPVPWTQLFDQLRLRLQANYVSLTIRSPAPGDPGLVIFAGQARPTIAVVYERSLYALDPFVKLPRDRVVMLQELIDEREWLDSVIYRDFLQPLQVRYMMGADLHTEEGFESRLRVSRGPDGAPFEERDRALCTLLLPHLKRALRLHARLGGERTERRLYAATLERLSIGTLILGAEGEILLCNRTAEQMLAESDGLQLHNGRLQASSGLDDRRLWRLIRKLIEARAEPGGSVVEAISLGRSKRPGSLGVLLRSIARAERYEAGPPAAIEVIIRAPERQAEPSESLLRQLFQLTPAEAALAVQLGHGLTLEQAAMDLNISRNTARAHLRVIFAKTGVSRQTALVQLLLSSVAALN